MGRAAGGRRSISPGTTEARVHRRLLVEIEQTQRRSEGARTFVAPNLLEGVIIFVGMDGPDDIWKEILYIAKELDEVVLPLLCGYARCLWNSGGWLQRRIRHRGRRRQRRRRKHERL